MRATRSEFIAAEELARAIGCAAPIVGRSFHIPAPRRAAKPAPAGARRTLAALALAMVSAAVLTLAGCGGGADSEECPAGFAIVGGRCIAAEPISTGGAQ